MRTLFPRICLPSRSPRTRGNEKNRQREKSEISNQDGGEPIENGVRDKVRMIAIAVALIQVNQRLAPMRPGSR